MKFKPVYYICAAYHNHHHHHNPWCIYLHHRMRNAYIYIKYARDRPWRPGALWQIKKHITQNKIINLGKCGNTIYIVQCNTHTHHFIVHTYTTYQFYIIIIHNTRNAQTPRELSPPPSLPLLFLIHSTRLCWTWHASAHGTSSWTHRCRRRLYKSHPDIHIYVYMLPMLV